MKRAPHIQRIKEGYGDKFTGRREMDWQRPGLKLLVKLGAIIVHLDEHLGEGGTAVDLLEALRLINDPDVKQWLGEGTEMGLLPLKRK